LAGANTLGQSTLATHLLERRDDAGRFISPGPADLTKNYNNNVVWLNGSQQKVQWQWAPHRTMETYSVKLYTEDNSTKGIKGSTLYSTILAAEQRRGIEYADRIIAKSAHDQEEGYFMWEVGGHDDSDLPMYFFWLMSETDGLKDSFISAYFNITDDHPEAQSSTISSVTPSNSPSPSTSASPTPASTSVSTLPSSTPSAAPVSSQKDSIPVALGVGLGIGVPLLILVGVIIGLKMATLRQNGLGASQLAIMHPEMRDSVPVSHDVPELVLPVGLPRPSSKPHELVGL
jgi:hypothetical protein